MMALVEQLEAIAFENVSRVPKSDVPQSEIFFLGLVLGRGLLEAIVIVSCDCQLQRCVDVR